MEKAGLLKGTLHEMHHSLIFLRLFPGLLKFISFYCMNQYLPLVKNNLLPLILMWANNSKTIQLVKSECKISSFSHSDIWSIGTPGTAAHMGKSLLSALKTNYWGWLCLSVWTQPSLWESCFSVLSSTVSLFANVIITRIDNRKIVGRPWKIMCFRGQAYPLTIYGQSVTGGLQQK